MKVNVPEYMERDDKTYKIITDHLGSPIIIIDTYDNNNIIKEIQYDSFGNIISDSNPDFEIPFGFAGGLYDKDTKLIRFGARDYDPETGRWTSKEPLGFYGSNNFYVYTNGDPVNYVDWSGLLADITGSNVLTPDRDGGESSEADLIQKVGYYEKGFYIQSGIYLAGISAAGFISNSVISFLVGNTASSVCIGAGFRDKKDMYDPKEILKDAILGTIVGVKMLPIKIGTSTSAIGVKAYFRFKIAVAMNVGIAVISGKQLTLSTWVNILLSSTLSSF